MSSHTPTSPTSVPPITQTQTQTPTQPTAKTPILLLDGGLGTTLSSPPYSYIFSSALTPLWSSHLLLSSSGREILCKVQKEFVDVGADVLLTPTYQVSLGGLERSGVRGREEGEKVMREGVGVTGRVVRAEGFGWGSGEEVGVEEVGRVEKLEGTGRRKRMEGKGKGKKVALSLGAYGATMIPSTEYSGAYNDEHRSVEQLSVWHLERLRAFYPSSSSSSSPTSNTNSGTEDREQKGEEEEVDQISRAEAWKTISLVAFETIPVLNEIYAVRSAYTSLLEDSQSPPSSSTSSSLEKSFYISCVFPPLNTTNNTNTTGKPTLPDGSTIRAVVHAMLSPLSPSGQPIKRPWGIGLNCTKLSRVAGLVLEFEEAVRDLLASQQDPALKSNSKSHLKWPALVLYPDGTAASETYDTTTQEWVTSSPQTQKLDGDEETKSWDEEVYEIVEKAAERGCWSTILVGGCCKTSPGDIGMLRGRIDGLRGEGGGR